MGGGSLRHEYDCWVLSGSLKLDTVGIRHAQNVPSKVDHSNLHPQADTQERLGLHRGSQCSDNGSSESVKIAPFMISLLTLMNAIRWATDEHGKGASPEQKLPRKAKSLNGGHFQGPHLGIVAYVT